MNFTDIYYLRESKLSSISQENYAPLLSPETRKKAIFFFKKYGNGNEDSNNLNWRNHKNFTDEDFKFLDNIIDTDEKGDLYFTQKSRSEIKKDTNRERFNVGKTAEDIFINKPEENILFHLYPEISNEDWLFVSPLTHEAAVFIDSRECGLGGACWCIGMKDRKMFWESYINNGNKFILAFNKHYNNLDNIKINGDRVNPNELNKWGIKHVQTNGNDVKEGDVCTYQDIFTKFMIQIDPRNNITVWIQPDKSYTLEELYNDFKIDFSVNKDDLLSLDFNEFNKYANPDFRQLIGLRRNGFIIDEDTMTVTAPSNIEIMKSYYLYKNKLVKHIILPDNIKELTIEAFWGLVSLEDIKLSRNIRKIPEDAFLKCKSLKKIEIPDSVRTIDEGAFNGCTSLTSVRLPKNLKVLKPFVFRDCKKLTNIELPSGLTRIRTLAFDGSGIKELDIPDSVLSIHPAAFLNCYYLKNIIVSSTLNISKVITDGGRVRIIRRDSKITENMKKLFNKVFIKSK